MARKQWTPETGYAEAVRRIAQAAESGATALYLRELSLTALPPEIGQLASLQMLALNDNQLPALPPEIGQLASLQTLALNDNQLPALPPEIGQLASLRLLFLAGNQLAALPPELGQLTSLVTLWLAYNHLTALPPEIGQLSSLQVLNLDKNRLTALPPEIGQLALLERLYLTGNQLSALPPEIGQLASLERLSLNHNQLSALPPAIGQLASLEWLSLSGNKLTALPPEIGQLASLQRLIVHSNSLESPPHAIAELGLEHVRDWFVQQELQENCGSPIVRRWTSKVVVIGEAGVGKSCLIQAILGTPCASGKSPASTLGVEITPWHPKHPDPEAPGIELDLQFWDFGGQEILHATNTFFLTDEAFYLLVWDSRGGYEAGKLRKWLEIIQAKAPNSRVLLVATHTDEKWRGHFPDRLLTDFPRLIQAPDQSLYEVDSIGGQGIPELREALRRLVVEHVGTMGQEWNNRWDLLSRALGEIRQQGRTTITHQEFMRLFDAWPPEEQPDEAGAVRLIKVLHVLGELLCYDNEPNLKDKLIIDPEWVAQNVGRVLQSDAIEHGLARFSKGHMALDSIWGGLSYEDRDLLLDLMEAFDLAFRIPDDPTHRSIVVEKLGHNQPPMPPDLEAEWNVLGALRRNLTYRFRFDITAPPGIPSWFIARTHKYTVHCHWRYGVMLRSHDGAHMAMLHTTKFDANDRPQVIELTVRGPYPEQFFTLLEDTFLDTLSRYKGLAGKWQVFMRCPCTSTDEPCTTEFDVGFMRRSLADQVENQTMTCNIWTSRGGAPFNIRTLLYGIVPETLPDVIQVRDALIEKSVERIVTTALAADRHLRQQELLQRENQIDIPRAFTIYRYYEVQGKSKVAYTELCLICEAEGCMHPPQTFGPGMGRWRIDDHKALITERFCAYGDELARALPIVASIAVTAAVLFTKDPLPCEYLVTGSQLAAAFGIMYPHRPEKVSWIDESSDLWQGHREDDMKSALLMEWAQLLDALTGRHISYSTLGLFPIRLKPTERRYWVCPEHHHQWLQPNFKEFAPLIASGA